MKFFSICEKEEFKIEYEIEGFFGDSYRYEGDQQLFILKKKVFYFFRIRFYSKIKDKKLLGIIDSPKTHADLVKNYKKDKLRDQTINNVLNISEI